MGEVEEQGDLLFQVDDTRYSLGHYQAAHNYSAEVGTGPEEYLEADLEEHIAVQEVDTVEQEADIARLEVGTARLEVGTARSGADTAELEADFVELEVDTAHTD